MAEVADLVGNLFKTKTFPSPEIVLPSQRQLAKNYPIVDVTAVDPANAYEIDDAFAVHKEGNKPLEVSVVIARGGLVPYTSPDFIEAMEAGWSLYPGDEGRAHYEPMFKNRELVTNDLSLIEGELRPGIEFSYQLLRNGRTRHTNIRPVAARTKCITYEEFGHRLLHDEYMPIRFAVDAIRQFRSGNKKRLNPHEVVARSTGSLSFSPVESLARKIVQELMVQTNKEAGRLAFRNQMPYIYRYTDLSPGTLPGSGLEELVLRAFYSHYPRRHEMLVTRKYTHSTSPLRRSMDNLDHQIWEFIFRGGNIADINVVALRGLTEYINGLILERVVRIGREF